VQVPAFIKPVMELGENLDPPPEVEVVPHPGNAPTPKAEPTYVAPAVARDPFAPDYDTVKATVPVPRCAPSLRATFRSSPSELRLEMVWTALLLGTWATALPILFQFAHRSESLGRPVRMDSRACRHFQGEVQRSVSICVLSTECGPARNGAQPAHTAA
jgi:hypothetical protein